jgi:hypothetical protein
MIRSQLQVFSLALFVLSSIEAFTISPIAFKSTRPQTSKLYQNTIHKVPEDDDTPISFLDPLHNTLIECYADSIAIIDGVEYTVGNPCDTAVALCYFDLADNLIPIDLDSPKMDEIFPIAAGIVEEEFGEELVLERTPQTLTLVGELEEGGEDEDYDDEDEDDIDEEEEEVEILLSFDEERTEYVLVKLLDPVLLVGRASEDENDQKCILLTEEEADRTMPALEEMFLEFKDSSE